jgi:hypothetical protein
MYVYAFLCVSSARSDVLRYRNLEQIRNAVLETVYIGVMEAYLRCKAFSHEYMRKYGLSSRHCFIIAVAKLNFPACRRQQAHELEAPWATCAGGRGLCDGTL